MKKELYLITAALFVAILLPSSVSADGMPLPVIKNIDLHSIEENHQYAFIEVLNETHEMIHLFLSIGYIGKEDTNITILIPLVSKPYYLDASRITDKEFLKKYNYNDIIKTKKLQSFTGIIERGTRVMNNYLDGYLEFTFFQSFFLYYLFEPFIQFNEASKGIEKVETFAFEAGMVEIYKVDSGQTLEEFLKENYPDVELPENLKDVVDKYRRHYIAIVTLELEGLDERSKEYYEYLEFNNPELLEKVLQFVRSNPEIQQKCEVEGVLYGVINMLCCQESGDMALCLACWDNENIHSSCDKILSYYERCKKNFLLEKCEPQIKNELRDELEDFIDLPVSNYELDVATNLTLLLYKQSKNGFQIDIGLNINGRYIIPSEQGLRGTLQSEILKSS